MTIQKLHAVLRKAGVTRSVSSTTQVRGWHNYSEGYSIDRYDGTFRIGYVGDRYRPKSVDERIAILNSYRETLEKAGIKSTRENRYVVVPAEGE